MVSRRSAAVAACVILISAVATVIYTTFPVTVVSRALLAGSVVYPYIVSYAAGDAITSTLSDGGGDKKIGGPIVTDLRTCGEAKLPAHSLPQLPFYCCQPMSASEPINFTLPDPVEPLRVRRPVHAVGAEHIAKYERAIALMKALPHTDPRSFFQLANVHCAYCTSSYRQTGNPELNVQIHFSWFFFVFHRAHMYFFERIAAKLIGEPGFAVPFWSWDVPEGMVMPPEFTNSSSPLYDPVRNEMHAPPKLVDLDYANVERNLTDEQQIQHNLRVMYKQVRSSTFHFGLT
jgi:polyphenol oxidase